MVTGKEKLGGKIVTEKRDCHERKLREGQVILKEAPLVSWILNAIVLLG